MFSFLKNLRREHIIKQSQISEEDWSTALSQLPLLHRLTRTEEAQLRKLAILFLHEKVLSGAHELEITLEIKLHIALQACLPILQLDIDWYSGWKNVIVYPAGFAPKRTQIDEFGIAHTTQDGLSGEAWQRGPVILSWADVKDAGQLDGHNVVIHEFVHKLDMINGRANGYPPLHKNMMAAEWSQQFSDAFADFRAHPKAGLDRYGATNPAEFFAVMSEVFFETPEILCNAYPHIYRELVLFFKQEPIACDHSA